MHCYIATLLHCFIATLLHWYSLHGYNVTMLQSYKATSSIKGCLPSKVIFHQRSSFMKGRFHERLSSWKVVFHERSPSKSPFWILDFWIFSADSNPPSPFWTFSTFRDIFYFTGSPYFNWLEYSPKSNLITRHVIGCFSIIGCVPSKVLFYQAKSKCKISNL